MNLWLCMFHVISTCLLWNEIRMGWLVGGALAWDYDAWDNMWNVVGKRVSWETLGDGVVSVYLDICLN